MPEAAELQPPAWQLGRGQGWTCPLRGLALPQAVSPLFQRRSSGWHPRVHTVVLYLKKNNNSAQGEALLKWSVGQQRLRPLTGHHGLQVGRARGTQEAEQPESAGAGPRLSPIFLPKCQLSIALQLSRTRSTFCEAQLPAQAHAPSQPWRLRAT